MDDREYAARVSREMAAKKCVHSIVAKLCLDCRWCQVNYLADARADGYRAGIEAAAKVADTGGADYPGDYRISAAIRAITPTKDGQK